MLLFSFLLLFGIGPLKCETDVFMGPMSNQAIVLDNHQVFILDIHESIVRVFDKDGNTLNTIGGRGSGPGLFSRPTAMYLYDEQLFVFSMRPKKIDVFSLDGSYLKTITTPRRAIQIGQPALPTSAGWAYMDHNKSIVIASHDFKSFKGIVGDYEKEILKAKPRIFKPFFEQAHIAVSPDHDTLFYILPSSTLTIHAYDVPTGKHRVFAETNIRPMSFDEETGQAMYEAAIDRHKKRGRKNPYDGAEFPSHYPLISSFRLTYDNLLKVDLYSAGKAKEPLFFDLSGSQTESELGFANSFRIIGRVGDWVYFAHKEDDQVIIRRVPEKDLHTDEVKELLLSDWFKKNKLQ